MSLSNFWKTSPEEVAKMNLRQIVALASSGSLSDGNDASVEFRELLSVAPPETLVQWAGQGVAGNFQDSGFALQDIVNEAGRRLGFAVERGPYRGKGKIGFDGLWTAPSGHSVVVETKTSDTYPIDLKKLLGYRDELIRAKKTREGVSSILIVIGRQENGYLDNQMRSSRLQVTMHFISVGSLFGLLVLKTQTADGGAADVLSRKIFDLCSSDDFFTYVNLDPAVRLLDGLPRMTLSEQPNGGLFPTMAAPLGTQGFVEDAKSSVKEIKDIVDYVTRKGEVQMRALRNRFHRLGAETFKHRMKFLVADDAHPERELKAVERRGLSGRTIRWVMPNE